MRAIPILIAALLSGCSLLPAAVGEVERQAADAVVESSERTLCVLIPVGTWMRHYGSSPERRAAWKALCSPTVEAPK